MKLRLIAVVHSSKLSFTLFVADPIAFFGRNRRMPRSPRLTIAAAADAVLPAWVKPLLTRLVKEAPNGDEWAHELKFDSYRMHARLDRGDARLLTRTGLDWTVKYPLQVDTMPLDVALPCSTRFGFRLELSRVHWVRPNSSSRSNS
jgi:ATP-dependent DNA ligase